MQGEETGFLCGIKRSVCRDAELGLIPGGRLPAHSACVEVSSNPRDAARPTTARVKVRTLMS